MRSTLQMKVVMAATALSLLTPAAAFAAEVEQTRTTTTQQQRGDEGGFDWGLLGLLGLAGLAGLGGKKRANDIHVDARHKTDGHR